jgi:hypothetical protein
MITSDGWIVWIWLTAVGRRLPAGRRCTPIPAGRKSLVRAPSTERLVTVVAGKAASIRLTQALAGSLVP